MEDNQSLKQRFTETLEMIKDGVSKELAADPATEGAPQIAAALIDVNKALARLTYGASNEVAPAAKPFDKVEWVKREKAKYQAKPLPKLPAMDAPEETPNPLDDMFGADDALGDLGEGGEGDILNGGIDDSADKDVESDAVNPLADKVTDDKPKGKGK